MISARDARASEKSKDATRLLFVTLQEDPGQGRLRLHSAEDSNFHSSNSLNESPNSESPRSWPSTFTTPMSYIKERKKRKASKFHIASPFDGDELKDNLFGGAEEHNLSQSINSDSVSLPLCPTRLQEERRKMMGQHLHGVVRLIISFTSSSSGFR